MDEKETKTSENKPESTETSWIDTRWIRSTIKRLVLPFTAVFAASAALLAVLYYRASVEGRSAMEIEAGKAMLSVIAAVLIGNIVLIVIRDYEEHRKGWNARRDLLRTDLTEGLADLYSRVKSVRRLGRTVLTNTRTSIDRKKYEKLFKEINDVQLQLERYRRGAGSGVTLKLIHKSVSTDLKRMEDYLDKLIREGENVPELPADSIPLSSLSQFNDLIGPHKGSNFQSDFASGYSDVSEAISSAVEKELLS